MGRQVVSRSQRRMEKKQALLLLVLVLAVALVSFGLGVMVGRSGPEQVASQQRKGSERIPISSPEAGSEASETKAGEEKADLTFYDSLPSGGETPLGSGINHPPESEEATAADEEKPPVQEEDAAQQGQATATTEPAAPDQVGATASEAPVEAALVVQVASFRKAEAARTLAKKLKDKGYRAFIRQVDLREKGVWQRVLVGPVEDSQQAGEIVARLQEEEHLSALVKNY